MCVTYLHPSWWRLRNPLKTAAAAWPPVMNMTLSVTSRPRSLADDVSAKYMGTIMLAKPVLVWPQKSLKLKKEKPTESLEIFTATGHGHTTEIQVAHALNN